MTREEAINGIRELKTLYGFTDELCEAADIAIEALCQLSGMDNMRDYMKGYRDGLKDAESAIHDKLRSL